MGARGLVHFFVFLFMLFTLVDANSGSKKDSEDDLLAYLINSEDIDRDMVELLWLNCRVELVRANEAIEDSSRRDDVLHPLVEQALLGCLRKQNLVFLVSGEEKGSPNRYTRWVELLSKRHKLKEDPKPPPATPNSKPSKSKDDNKSKKKSNGGKKTNNNGMPAIAVYAAAVGTCVLVLLLCLCCCCKCCRKSKKGLNDEKPLLSLSSSDYSAASSRKSSRNDDSKVEISLGSSADSAQVPRGRMGPAGMPPLKPPPGRVIPSEAPAKPAPPPPPPPAKTASPAPSAPPPAKTASPAPSALPPPPPVKPGPSAPAKGPPPPPPAKPIPRPPPPGSGPPRPGMKVARRSPNESESTSTEGDDASKTKLKPFFWDKVQANTDQSMVWQKVKAGSFQFDEEQIESLFGYASVDKKKSGSKKESSSQDASNFYIQIIDQKKAQNLSILLKALNVTTAEVCDALKEGNELPSELIQTLIKMAPTAEEELKLRLYNGDISRLGQAERFLKALVEVPLAFKRLETLHFMCILHDEASVMKESFATLEAACTELRNSRLFLKLLEAVLKTGNRMNDGTFRGGAQAFKLDTLLKLSDVKGVDGKTTLLHFVVQEIIRSEGIRAARASRDLQSMSSIKSVDLNEDLTQDSEDYYRSTGLQVVSSLSSELENVKKASILDADNLTGTVSKLGHALIKARDFLNSEMKNVDEEDGFHLALKSFVQKAEGDVMLLLEEEKRIMALVKSTGDYFHGHAKKDEGLRLFVIVRDFLVILDKVCREVKNAPRKQNSTPRRENVAVSTSPQPDQSIPSPKPDQRQKLFPAIADRRIDDSSSDDDT